MAATEVDWTYQTPAGGADAVGLEEYLVYDRGGNTVGKVVSLLRHDDDLFVAVDRGAPPATHDRWAIPLRHVASIDHDALAVHLSGSPDDALHLRNDRAVENDDADAIRVDHLPNELLPPPASPRATPGPEERPFGALAIGSYAITAFSALVVLALISQRNAPHWRLGLIAVPVALLLVSAALTFRAWVRPHRSGTRRRDPR
jgi:hypothetical protein